MNRIQVFFATCMLQFGLNAQTSVNGAGGEATGSNGQMSFSVGEIVYTTMNNSSYSIAQGIQQPYIPPFNYTVSATNNTICSGTTVTLSVNVQPSYPAGTVHCNGTPTAVVDVTNPITGKTWMDRNLGASRAATSSTDASSYGDLYQWGRGADGHQCRNSATTSTLSSTDQPGHGDFILVPNTPYDWRSPQNANLWQGVNGVNNPCPSGYRLPTRMEFESELATWLSDDAFGAFTSLRLSMAGGRLNDDGSFLNVGSFGAYWYSTVSANNGIGSSGLGFNTSSRYPNDNYRSIGRSIRCIKN